MKKIGLAIIIILIIATCLTIAALGTIGWELMKLENATANATANGNSSALNETEDATTPNTVNINVNYTNTTAPNGDKTYDSIEEAAADGCPVGASCDEANSYLDGYEDGYEDGYDDYEYEDESYIATTVDDSSKYSSSGSSSSNIESTCDE